MKKEPRTVKFNFEQLRVDATSKDAQVRKDTFKDYFERFEEFPSYLFDNSHQIDALLFETIQDLEKDPETTKAMRRGIEILMMRLPAHE